MNILPNVSATTFTTSAFIIGLLLCDGLTPAEQNALGGWFMLVGQTLSTNSGQQQLLNNRNGTSNNYNAHVINDDDIKKHVNNIKNEVNDIWSSNFFK